MNEWMITFLLVYGVISIYYAIVNSYAIAVFEEAYKEELEGIERVKEFRKYIRLLPFLMALLSIFWPVFLILKRFLSIKIITKEM